MWRQQGYTFTEEPPSDVAWTSVSTGATSVMNTLTTHRNANRHKLDDLALAVGEEDGREKVHRILVINLATS